MGVPIRTPSTVIFLREIKLQIDSNGVEFVFYQASLFIFLRHAIEAKTS